MVIQVDNMSVNRYLTPEIKAAILKDNESLTGSMWARSHQLAKTHKYSVHTLMSVIKPTMDKIKRNITEDEKQQIRVLYSLEKGNVEQHKFKRIGEQFGFSAQSIRNVIKAKKEVYFNYKMEMF